MWRGRSRLRRLEEEIAQGKAERAELRRRLQLFEQIAAAAGAALTDPDAAEESTPVPPALLAAARESRSRDVPVRLEVAGAEVVAVIGGHGDPREWWKAIEQAATDGDQR